MNETVHTWIWITRHLWKIHVHTCNMIHIHVWTISCLIHTWTCMNHLFVILVMYESYMFIHDLYSCMNYFIHNPYMNMYEPCTFHAWLVWIIHDPVVFMYHSCMIHTCSFSMGNVQCSLFLRNKSGASDSNRISACLCIRQTVTNRHLTSVRPIFLHGRQ